MMRKFLVLILLLSPVFVPAQKKDKHIEKLANSITAEDMKKHLYIIAGADMEGRDTPSSGLEKAAAYIEEQFKILGLQPGNKGDYRQYYPLYRDSMISASLSVSGKEFELNKDFQPLTANYTAEMRFSEIVFAGYGISDGEIRNDYKDLNVAGKAVMILDGSPADYKPSQQGFRSPANRFAKINAAMSKGAVALIVVYNNYSPTTLNRLSNWSMSGYRATQSPLTYNVSADVASFIMGVQGQNIFEIYKSGDIAAGKMFNAEIKLGFTKQTQSTFVSNVMALLEGTDKKNEYIVITAHYDHIGKRNDGTIYYGADDDGSGTTAVLELAEAFAQAKKAGKGPRRSILFMTVSGEEKGLWGSRFYSDNPIFPLEKTTVNLNMDMIGRIGNEYLKDKDSVNYIYVIGDDKLSSELQPLKDKVNNTYTKLKLDRKYNDPNDPNMFYYRSDHYNFARKGVPILFYFNGVHADYHRPTDTPDKINYPLMAKRAQLVFYTAMEIANRPEMLKRDIELKDPRSF
jgi:hypothetical protein